MGEFSLPHILILGFILLIFLGPGRLPGVAKGLGEAIRDFKKALNGEEPKQAERIEQEKEKQKNS
jgi:sec-independent protein translocase protein TatA